MEKVVTKDRYDYEAWSNQVLDGLVSEYRLSEVEAISVLSHQKTLVNKLFNEFTQNPKFSFSETLGRLMDDDLENDCYN